MQSVKQSKQDGYLRLVSVRNGPAEIETQAHSLTSGLLSDWIAPIAFDLGKHNVAINILRPASVVRSSSGDVPSTEIPGVLSVEQVAGVAVLLLSKLEGTGHAALSGAAVQSSLGVAGNDRTLSDTMERAGLFLDIP